MRAAGSGGQHGVRGSPPDKVDQGRHHVGLFETLLGHLGLPQRLKPSVVELGLLRILWGPEVGLVQRLALVRPAMVSSG